MILYATSKTDAKKYKAVAESMRAAFNAEVVDQNGKSGGKTLNQFEETIPQGGTLIDMPAGRSNIMVQDNVELKHLADILEESLSFELGASDIAEKLQIINEDRGLVVRLSAKDFFEPGEAQVKAEALPVLDKMAKILKTVERRIRIEGHTDTSKISSEYYPSNWELSTARAAWIVRYLIKQYQFNPKLLEASGYAEHHPIAPNDTERNRGKNRRVEILVLSKDRL